MFTDPTDSRFPAPIAGNRGNKDLLKARAAIRRQVLVENGLSTYRMGVDTTGEPRAIMCLCCGFTSYAPGDIVNRYCGFCHAYQTEWTRPDAEPLGFGIREDEEDARISDDAPRRD